MQQQSQESQNNDAQTSSQVTAQSSNSSESNQSSNATTVKASSIKATPAMVRCSKIMKMQRDIHTTVLSSLEGIAEQVYFDVNQPYIFNVCNEIERIFQRKQKLFQIKPGGGS